MIIEPVILKKEEGGGTLEIVETTKVNTYSYSSSRTVYFSTRNITRTNINNLLFGALANLPDGRYEVTYFVLISSSAGNYYACAIKETATITVTGGTMTSSLTNNISNANYSGTTASVTYTMYTAIVSLTELT